MTISLRQFTGNNNSTARFFDDGSVYSANSLTGAGTLVSETNKRGTFSLEGPGQGGNNFTMTITIDGNTLTNISFRQFRDVLAVNSGVVDFAGPFTFENDLNIEILDVPTGSTAQINLLTTP